MAKIKLNNVRLSFPVLWSPQPFTGDKNPNPKLSYGAAFIMPPDHPAVKAINAEIQKVATETWKAKTAVKLALLKGNPQKYCFRSGDEKEYDGYKGMLVLSSKRPADKGPPLVLDRNASALGAGAGKPYAGCFVDASVDLWAQEGQHEGIRATLLGVQFRSDGDAFSAGAQPDPEDFSDLTDQGEGGETATAEDNLADLGGG